MQKNNLPNSALSTRFEGLFYWLPPLLWMSMIFFFSTDNFSGRNTGSIIQKVLAFIYPSLTFEQFKEIHFFIRKAAHFTEYAILSFLLYRAFRGGRIPGWRWSWAIYTLLIIVAYALLDEFHQTFTSTRVGSIYDSLTDISGGVFALAILWLSGERSKR